MEVDIFHSFVFITRLFQGAPLNVSMEIKVASFDSISEVNMVICFCYVINIFFNELNTLKGLHNNNLFKSILARRAFKIW